MTKKEMAIQLLENIPESKMIYVIGFLEGVSVPDEQDPFYSPENMARLKESIAQLESSGGTLHEIDLDG